VFLMFCFCIISCIYSIILKHRQEKKEKEEASLYEELRRKHAAKVNPFPSNIVKLNVRGSLKMWIGKEKIMKEKGSVLCDLLEGKLKDLDVHVNEKGEVLLDCDANAFQVILEWFDTKAIPIWLGEREHASVLHLAQQLRLKTLVIGMGGKWKEYKEMEEEEEEKKRRGGKQEDEVDISEDVLEEEEKKGRFRITQGLLLQYMQAGQGHLALPWCDLSNLYLAGIYSLFFFSFPFSPFSFDSIYM
jgi:hypothetical protein